MFETYKRTNTSEMRPVTEQEVTNRSMSQEVSISKADLDNGSPKLGDMIARNPNNHVDQWLIAKVYFEDNFEKDITC